MALWNETNLWYHSIHRKGLYFALGTSEIDAIRGVGNIKTLTLGIGIGMPLKKSSTGT